MAIPDYQTLMLPLLKHLSDGKEHSLNDCVPLLGETMKLTPRELDEMLPSGQQLKFHNRVGWARTYMKMAGLVETTRRSYFKITKRGLDVLKKSPDRIDVKFLSQYEEFNQFRERHLENKQSSAVSNAVLENPPEENIDEAIRNLRKRLTDDLLDQIKKCSPAFFERLVIDLLVKMGYGGSIQDAGQAIGKSGDEGIDGVIKEDKLGLDAIYVQAKRWEATVGRPQIQNFVGALHGKGDKGVFITTSAFSKDATDYAKTLGNTKVILIDGERLADLMIEYNIGVSTKQTYEIKKVDYDYFEDEE